MTLRIGVLGAARIAPSAIVKPARAIEGAEVVAVAARDEAKARGFAAKHGIPTVHQSYDALIADPDVDAIYNPLPNGLHGAWTVRALEAGKHVLCEKPFTANAAEAREVAAVADAARERGTVTMEAFHWRYHPLATRLLDLVNGGDLGRLERVEAVMLAPLLRSSDIRWQLALAGGSMMDMGCYPASFARTMAQAEPEVTHAEARLRSPGIDRYLRAELRFPNGATGRITCGMLSAPGIGLSARMRFERGDVRVLNPFAPQYFCRLSVRGPTGRKREKVVRTPTYNFQLEAFVDAVRDHTEPVTGTAFAIANMELVDACYRAAGLEPRTPTPVA